ncbi:MAG: hypothetical protein V3T01_08375 [Myxococcota bacterium]
MTEATVPAVRPAPRPRMAGVLLIVVPLLAMSGFVVGMATGVRGDKVLMLFLGVVTGIVTFIPMAIDQMRAPENRHLMLSLLSMAYLVVFAVPAFAIYLPAAGPVEPAGMTFTAVSASDIITGQVIALVALISLLVGYALPMAPLIASVIPKPKRDWPLRTTFLVGCMMIPFGWAIELIATFGFLPAALGSGFLGALSLSAWFGLSVLALAFIRYRSYSALILLLVLVPVSMGFAFFSGSKGQFLRPVMLIVLVSWLYRREIRGRWVLAGILAGALVYPAGTFYRNAVKGGETTASMLRHPAETVSDVAAYVSEYSIGGYLTEGVTRLAHRFDGLGRSSVIIRETPSRVPFQGGWTLAQIPLAYIPRVLWPGKPSLGIGQWITDTYGAGSHIRSSTGPTWVGEFYLNFGTVGVIVGMLTMGFLLRLLHECLLRSATVPTLVAGVVILLNTSLEIQGGLIGTVNGVTFSLAPIFATHMVLRFMGATVPIEADPQAQARHRPRPGGELGSDSRPLGWTG